MGFVYLPVLYAYLFRVEVFESKAVVRTRTKRRF
jgi:hypothetical protein